MSVYPKQENKNIEFKELLNPEIHLKAEKKQHLASQMKYRLEEGNGKAIYVIGIDDSGQKKGLGELEFAETLNVLKIIAAENKAKISKIEKFGEQGKITGKVLIEKNLDQLKKEHLIIATAGHVGHGKSTLIGTLMTGREDKNGKNWLYLNVLPHEIERGLSADLHYSLFAFNGGQPLHFQNPLDKRERSQVVEKAEKIISFIDTVGHEPWLRTTIRGIVGQNIDYGMVVVAADDGVTHITKEHIGLLLAINLPIIVCITKIDKMGKKRIEEVESQVENLLKNVGRVPFSIKNENDLIVAIDKMEAVVPVIKISATTLEGFDLLKKLLFYLPVREKELDKPFLMFIDRIYNVSGVGTVVSGTVKQGRLAAGKELLLGPDASGKFKKVKATSIEMHYHRIPEADAGFVVGIALRGTKHEEVERGMVICDETLSPRCVKSFEAEILVLNHPTRIANGYEPVFHGQTVAGTVKLQLMGKEYLKAGENGKVLMSFRYRPQYLRENDKFVFREGKTKGIGTVTRIAKFA